MLNCQHLVSCCFGNGGEREPPVLCVSDDARGDGSEGKFGESELFLVHDIIAEHTDTGTQSSR